MKGYDFYWNEIKLFQFLTSPEDVITDSGMIFDGWSDPYDVASVVEYLKYLKTTTTEIVDR